MNEETRKRFFSSNDQNWATPIWLFNRFNEIFNFKLDPCCVPETAKCNIFFTPSEDGLNQEWYKIGNSFVNPPFSRELSKWIKKSYEESLKGIIVCMLIPARPDTISWNKYCLNNGKILFIKGRIKFEDKRKDPIKKLNPAFFPSALVVFGNTQNLNLSKLNDLGIWVSKLDLL